MSDEKGFVASRLAQDIGEAEEEFAVGELFEGAGGFHAHNIGSDFSRAGDRACGAPRRAMRFEASEANARLLAHGRIRGARSASRLRSRAKPLSKVVKGRMQKKWSGPGTWVADWTGDMGNRTQHAGRMP